jgi:hypothetical protein
MNAGAAGAGPACGRKMSLADKMDIEEVVFVFQTRKK